MSAPLHKLQTEELIHALHGIFVAIQQDLERTDYYCERGRAVLAELQLRMVDGDVKAARPVARIPKGQRSTNYKDWKTGRIRKKYRAV